MALSDEIEFLLDEFGTNLKEDLQQSLRDKGVTFGGQDSKLSNKIQFEITSKGESILFKIKMPEYGEAVDKGRKAANISIEGSDSIANWAKRKGIVGKIASTNLEYRVKKQAEAKLKNKNKNDWKVLKKPSFEKQLKAAAYIIKRGVERKGFKGNHFFSEVVEDGRLEVLKKRISNDN